MALTVSRAEHSEQRLKKSSYDVQKRTWKPVVLINTREPATLVMIENVVGPFRIGALTGDPKVAPLQRGYTATRTPIKDKGPGKPWGRI